MLHFKKNFGVTFQKIHLMHTCTRGGVLRLVPPLKIIFHNLTTYQRPIWRESMLGNQPPFYCIQYPPLGAVPGTVQLQFENYTSYPPTWGVVGKRRKFPFQRYQNEHSLSFLRDAMIDQSGKKNEEIVFFSHYRLQSRKIVCRPPPPKGG